MIYGNKTKTGAIGLGISGGLYIGQIVEPVLAIVSVGLALMSAGLVAFGIWSRLCWVFYKPAEGNKKPDLRRPKLERGRMM